MLRVSLLVLMLGSIAACGHGPGGKLAVDIPVLPYLPPDVEEISGTVVDEDKEPEEPKGTEPAPAPAPPPKK